MNIRKAEKSDQEGIALCIAEGFKRDFDLLCKDTKKVAKALSLGIQTDKFYVAEAENKIVGVAGVSDCTGRAVKTDTVAYIRNFGLLKGLLAKLVLKGEFEKPLKYPASTGFIEFVAVRRSEQRKGIATKLLKTCLLTCSYQEFILDVISANAAAFSCYTNLGFKEFKRISEKHGHKEAYEKILMRYEKGEHLMP